ncbi:MAG: hypothetical protein AAB289_04120, partial [Chloroflexota bacterium]
LFPRYDGFVAENAIRQIGATMLPCNWLQCQENSLDPTHAEWLHFYYGRYLRQRMGKAAPRPPRRHVRIGFSRYEHGLIKRRVLEGGTEEDDNWRVGHPIIFPNYLRQGTGGRSGYIYFQIRVPVDDTHTWHLMYMAYIPGVPMPPQASIPFFDVPLYDQDGKVDVSFLDGQDQMAWVSQGPVAKRDQEHLGQGDIGVIMFRDLLQEQIERVERGEDPMEVYRDPATNQRIDFVHEGMQSPDPYPGYALRGGHMKFSPEFGVVAAAYREAEQRHSTGEALMERPLAPLVPWHPGGSRAIQREVDIFPANTPLPPATTTW